MLKRAVGVVGLFLAFSWLSYAQTIPQYSIKAQLHPIQAEIEVEQRIVFTHNESTPLNEVYLVDWNHAFSSTESPLAKRLIEEYTRSFYLSSKSKRGETQISVIEVNGEEIKWERVENQLDQIRISLSTPLEAKTPLRLGLKYRLKLPDSKFTGYGKVDDSTFILENVFLRLARRSQGKWELISHLDLEDHPGVIGNFTIDFNLPIDLRIQSNLNAKAAQFDHDSAIYIFNGERQKTLRFFIGNDFGFTPFKFGNKEIVSNLDNNDLSEGALRYSLMKVVDYLHKNVGQYPHDRILLAQTKYDKRPFYGLTLVPSFLKPFPRQMEFEVKALNTYLYQYLFETLNLHPRKDFWLLGGLHSYLMMQYVLEHYPNKKLLDLIMRQPIARFFLKNYHFTDLKFNDTFIEFHEFILRRNLQQSLSSSKEKLIKFNEQIGNPSHMGLLMHYLNAFESIDLKGLFNRTQENSLTGEALKDEFYALLSEDNKAFAQDYINQRNSLDLQFRTLKRTKNSVEFSIAEKNDKRPPFKLGWIKNDSLIKVEQYSATNFDEKIQTPLFDADYLVINPKERLPEFNSRNNWKKVKGIGVKPLQFSFVKDLENPKKNQIFYNPRMEFNAYDGIYLGVRLNNRSVKSKPFTFRVEPFYATLEQSLVGSFHSTYSKYNENSPYYLKQFNFAGASYHYNNALRYTSIASSFNIYKRADNLRNNRKELVNAFWQYVHREQNVGNNTSPNYNIGGLNYIISNRGALDYFTLNARFEAGAKFGKFNFTTEYRHLMRSGRQWSVRLFAGKFLWRNQLTTNFFDYALDRPTDYLFQYNYIGRSETTGIYSQQFIPAEGGFKSRFEQPYVDDFLLSLNTSIGLWKWIEAYGDLGYMQRKNQSAEVLFGSGFRLNLVPDFLEVYFPFYNSNGLQMQGPRYHEKIRYVIVLDLQTLTQLFSRKWL